MKFLKQSKHKKEPDLKKNKLKFKKGKRSKGKLKVKKEKLTFKQRIRKLPPERFYSFQWISSSPHPLPSVTGPPNLSASPAIPQAASGLWKAPLQSVPLSHLLSFPHWKKCFFNALKKSYISAAFVLK